MKRPQFSIYTNQLIILEYFLCKYCVNYHSHVEFTFQFVDKNTFVTKEDNYRKIYYLNYNVNYNVRSISCIILFNICAQKVITYYLVMRNYNSIKILKGYFVGRIFIKAENHVLTELFLNSKSFTCEYFHCVMDVVPIDQNYFCSKLYTCDGSFLYFAVKSKQYRSINVKTFSDTIFLRMISGKIRKTSHIFIK